ncbi:MAG TPA: DUF4384 domain-containing protein [Hyphomicrobiaceae bacterium]|nr:DUF4384 domain-containing protein [Hyphomicrobiaceae bacterium]
MVTAAAGLVLLLGVGGIAAETAGDVPKMPEDPVAAKAYSVLDRHCASCHQRGRIAPDKRAGGGIDTILDLESVLVDRRLVLPGLPEASPVFTSMLSRTMPPASSADANGELTSAQVEAVRDWLLRKGAVQRDCRRLSHVQSDADNTLVEAFLRKLGAERARTTRLISMGRSVSGCAASGEVERREVAVRFTLNSLSWAPQLVRLDRVTDDGAIQAVDLADIGWTVDQWEALVSGSPYQHLLGANPVVRSLTGSKSPMARADWFVSTALRAPFYYEALGLPDTLEALVAASRGGSGSEEGRRIGLADSAVSRGRRIIERYPFANGGIWVAADFLNQPGRPDVLAPGNGVGTDQALLLDRLTSGAARNDASFISFDLPNGFRAYFAADGNGRRVDDVATSVAADAAYPHVRIGAGLGCASCHGGSGVLLSGNRSDELASRLRGDGNGARGDRDRALKRHFSGEELARFTDGDRSRYRQALTAAGITSLSDPSPVSAVVALYESPLVASDVEQETGLVFDDLAPLRSKIGARGSETLAGLQFGAQPRRAVEHLVAEVGGLRAGDIGSALGASVVQGATGHPERISLRIVAESPKASVGDSLVLNVRADKACHLTLIGVDPKGRAMVLYPNELEPQKMLEPGTDFVIPGPSSAYLFRMKTKGTETIIGICTSSPKPVDGIRHDYERQRFTLLGDYRTFLQRAWVSGDEEENEGRSQRGRGKAPEARPVRVPRGDIQGRTAIQIRVD